MFNVFVTRLDMSQCAMAGDLGRGVKCCARDGGQKPATWATLKIKKFSRFFVTSNLVAHA